MDTPDEVVQTRGMGTDEDVDIGRHRFEYKYSEIFQLLPYPIRISHKTSKKSGLLNIKCRFVTA